MKNAGKGSEGHTDLWTHRGKDHRWSITKILGRGHMSTFIERLSPARGRILDGPR